MEYTVLFFAYDEIIDSNSFLTLELAKAYVCEKGQELKELQMFAGCGYVEIHRYTSDTAEVIYEHAI